MYLAKTFLKQVWWSAKIVKITTQIFFLPFSENYKLTRKDPDMLELIVVILYQDFFRLKPVSNILAYMVELGATNIGPRSKDDILG